MALEKAKLAAQHPAGADAEPPGSLPAGNTDAAALEVSQGRAIQPAAKEALATQESGSSAGVFIFIGIGLLAFLGALAYQRHMIQEEEERLKRVALKEKRGKQARRKRREQRLLMAPDEEEGDDVARSVLTEEQTEEEGGFEDNTAAARSRAEAERRAQREMDRKWQEQLKKQGLQLQVHQEQEATQTA